MKINEIIIESKASEWNGGIIRKMDATLSLFQQNSAILILDISKMIS